jgi:phospho-N-acetylmuramoyl-pentapeptide-transferase
MLYKIFTSFATTISGLNVAKYITFRAIMSLLTALLISFVFSPWFIKKLKNKQLGQIIRKDGPRSHFSKQGTPTMGGGLIVLAVIISSLLWVNYANQFLWLTLFIVLSYTVLGLSDDYLKISKKNSDGVSARKKMFWQIITALSACSYVYFYIDNSSVITFPFIKNLTLDLGPWYILFAAFIIVGTSNAVNLTDGLDGLAIGPIIIAFFSYAVFCYVSGNLVIAKYLNFPYVENSGELTIICSAIIGAGLGFLWYNTYPAQVFMGDIGSLPLGGALGAIAVFSKHEILLVIVGGIFVIEALSVITQVLSFKLTRKRIFRMAPIHHHFELKGWPEPKIIVRFWIISIILSLLALLSLKIR